MLCVGIGAWLLSVGIGIWSLVACVGPYVTPDVLHAALSIVKAQELDVWGRFKFRSESAWQDDLAVVWSPAFSKRSVDMDDKPIALQASAKV